MSTPSREIHLVKRPRGPADAGRLRHGRDAGRRPGDGEVLVRNLYMSVDPAMRPRMSVGQELNEAMGGGALGRVEKSRNPAFKEGDLVTNRFGFREVFTSDGTRPAAPEARARPAAHRAHGRRSAAPASPPTAACCTSAS